MSPIQQEIEFQDYAARLARQAAILKIASGCAMSKLDDEDMEAVAQLADDDGMDLASMAMDKSLWRPL